MNSPAFVFVLIAAAAFAADVPQPIIDLTDWPVKISREAQFFVDDYLVATKAGVAFRVHQAAKHPANPLLRTGPPWETSVIVYGSVLRENGRWRMWYTNNLGLAYAESPDGLRWERPPVGIEIDGQKSNLLSRGHRGRSDTATIFRAPGGGYLGYVQEYRYPDKDGVREQRREGVYLRTSPDGIHWTERPEPVMYSIWRNKQDNRVYTGFELGDVHHIAWDARLGRYMGHVKFFDLERLERMRGLTESEDGIHWSEPHLILRADSRDRPGDQLYSLVAFPYESIWVGLVGVYHKTSTERMDIQLAFSRDGRNWTRPHREPFLANGPEGSFDWGVLHVSNTPPILEDGKLRFYYGGFATRHNERVRGRSTTGIGLATLRPGGFVSLTAGERPGTVLTRPLLFEGGKLTLNAAVRPGGYIRVLESLPVTGDGVALPVRWKESNPLTAGKYVRLRFEIRNADLYSFRIE
ncbi:MAG: hypothetical protein ACE15B_00715 [Bryobacteraceae bacterium]